MTWTPGIIHLSTRIIFFWTMVKPMRLLVLWLLRSTDDNLIFAAVYKPFRNHRAISYLAMTSWWPNWTCWGSRPSCLACCCGGSRKSWPSARGCRVTCVGCARGRGVVGYVRSKQCRGITGYHFKDSNKYSMNWNLFNFWQKIGKSTKHACYQSEKTHRPQKIIWKDEITWMLGGCP